jgi:hypothetical protein
LKVLNDLIFGLRRHSYQKNLRRLLAGTGQERWKPPAAPKGGPAKATWYNRQRVGGQAIKTLTR